MKPTTTLQPLDGISTEMTSAQSSLNLPPEPFPDGEEKGDAFYLSELDHNVHHAMEHLRQANEYLRQARAHRETTKHALRGLILYISRLDDPEGGSLWRLAEMFSESFAYIDVAEDVEFYRLGGDKKAQQAALRQRAELSEEVQ